MRWSLALATLYISLGTPTDSSRRDDISSPDVCERWAHQAAVVDTTLYIYGGRSRATALQTDNTWNNDFLKLDLSEDFDIASTPIQGLPKPNGPPPVALGYLWNDLTDLYLYGGQFSDTPPVSPTAFQLWKYSLKDSTWSVPDTTNGDSIQRAAEGAGVSIPNRGKGYYFGGHLDGYTTQGWSQSIPRLYLTSMVEYDMNSATWTNHTETGASFPERADGVLTFIPWGEEGILLALGGGGYTGQELSCDTGVYVFDASSLQWQTSFKGGDGTGGDSTNIYEPDKSSFYSVPALVVSQIGGGSTGGATVTAPEHTPVADSPLTGNNPDYTYSSNAPQPTSNEAQGSTNEPQPTSPNASQPSPVQVTSTITGSAGVETTVVTETPTNQPPNSGNNNNNRGTSVGIIVGATVGGVAFVIGALLFILFLWYKRRVRELHQSYEEQRETQGLVDPEGRPTSMASSGYPATINHGRSKEDLMEGVEPTFWGMLLQPRRSLRVVNH
ncbi:hypothetical protein AA313_de0206200 [Arthrobotrys entomopaga]|nr:hypothetical protein AA313_de0206200 [Arthrobotrys entomopaga]